MNPRRLLTSILLLLALLGALPAHAQEKGGIAGKVSDRRSGHAIAFASITVVEAKRGVLTDSEGQYLVSGILPGTYEVRVQFLGYKPQSRTGVTVAAGKPLALNFQLEEMPVQMKEIEVTAERRLVEVKQGATVRSVSASEMRNLPVQTIGEVLQQQAGINTEADQIHVRGGRADETVFVVNGVANRDLVTGQSTASTLNARSVAEVNVATGAYDVRYGNALSGVVEVKLKEGGDKFAGGLTYQTGIYGARNLQLVLGGPDPVFGTLFKALRLPGQVAGLVDLSGTLYETRYLSERPSNWFTGLFSNRLRPGTDYFLRSGYEDSFFGRKFKYGSFFGPSQDNRWAGRYTATWKPNAADKVAFNFSKRIAIDQGFSRTFITATGDVGDPAYPWSWDHRIRHAQTIFEDNVQTSLEWRRALSTSGFTTAQVSRYYFARRQDVMGKNWTQYEQPDDYALPPADSAMKGDFFIDSGDDDTWQDRRSTAWSLQWNLTQRVKRHELEVGLEHQFQTVQYATITDPWTSDPSGLGQAHDLWRVHPWVGDFYLRDRLEYEGFTANIGLRADYYFVGREAEAALADTANRNVSPGLRDEFVADTRSFFGRRYKLHLSPRIIVAHPISANSSFFFNYGEFTQVPSYRYVYSKLTSISSEAFPLLGNPNLNPQVSVNYEVGAKHQFTSAAAVNATFFQKDVYDYPTATTFQRSQGTSLVDIFVYLNGHFARSKGLEIELEKRRSHFWAGKLIYTFQQTTGKSSDPNEQRVVQEGGGDAAETRLSETYVSWNRPHKLTVNFDVRFDDRAPERFPWLRHSGLNLFVSGQSGRAYTPINTTSTQAATPYSRNARFQVTTDMRVNHYFKLGTKRLDLSLIGTNIFSNHLIYRVDRVTGRGRVWGEGEYDPHLFPNINDYTYVSQLQDPSNYGPGAQYRLQFDYDF